ncbi:MAG: hypothetical protein OEV74_15490 [Cyclobacteriaceae bacterium]|nr:hypothetical protein [Cyclobacteriaceae bacterium]MDH4297681.1 hypothetical protein [Cyclobacteriaceae bacterium]MDH5250257.1 hypothetical protein [Cyclobacteriaceae bacterium]
MKSLSIMQIFSFLILLITLEYAHAQDFVVTTLGDTVRGEVKPLFYSVDKKVQLKGADKKKIVYPMFKVLAFQYKGDIYQPVKGPNGYTFMKLQKAGYLSLYSFQLANQATFDGLFLSRKDGTGLEVPNLSFKKFMKKFLEDCPSVVEQIDNGDLGKKELNEIVDAYNQCVDDRTIDHSKLLAEKEEQSKSITALDILEEKVKSESDFEGKDDALDMIKEIKEKIVKSEKIPNFLLDGLKSSLAQDAFKEELENALKEIN